MRYVLFFYILVSLSSCNMSDSSIVIFDGYEFISESKKNRYIIGGRNNIIPPNVVDYEFDELFLVAKQIADVDYYIVEKANEIFDRGESNASVKDSIYRTESIGRHEKFKQAIIIAKEHLGKTDSLYIKSIQNKYLYWVVERKTDRLIGPLTDSEFQSLRKHINIKISMQ